MEINITVNAPELAQAINNLAQALTVQPYPRTQQTQIQPVQAQPVQAQPVQPEQMQPTVMPVQQPTVMPVQAQQMQPQPMQPQPMQPQPMQQAPVMPVQAQPIPTAMPVQAQPLPTMPTQVKEYTLDDIAKAGAQLVDAGKRELAQAVLTRYGFQTLANVPKEAFGALATEFRALGATI